jgi:hypothetical protein
MPGTLGRLSILRWRQWQKLRKLEFLFDIKPFAWQFLIDTCHLFPEPSKLPWGNMAARVIVVVKADAASEGNGVEASKVAAHGGDCFGD